MDGHFEGPKPFVIVPDDYYCVVENPVVMENGKAVIDTYGQYKLKFCDKEVRTKGSHQDPFPLYPGENMILVC